MRAAVCDDNVKFLEEMERTLRGMSDLVDDVSIFQSSVSFLFSVESGSFFDVVLMDLDWRQERTGMDAAEELYRLSPKTRVIYVTGYNDRFSQHIFLHPANLSGYLTKPVALDLLRSNLEKVAGAIATEPEESLLLHPRGAPVSIPIREILYLESSGHTTYVHTLDETISIYKRLSAVEEMLPKGFFRCHKSYIVNLYHVRRINSTEVTLKDGSSVPVSRTRMQDLKQAYFQFVGQSV